MTNLEKQKSNEILLKELESRLLVIKNGVNCSLKLIKSKNFDLIESYFDDIVRYGQLAQLDIRELNERAHKELFW